MTQQPTTASRTTPYRRRRPERTLLYRTVSAHVETWLALRRGARDDADAVPGYVEHDFRRYLECGILAHGFVGVSGVATNVTSRDINLIVVSLDVLDGGGARCPPPSRPLRG